MASGRGAVGQHAVSLKPLLGTSAASGFNQCMLLPVATCRRRRFQWNQNFAQRNNPLTPLTTVRSSPLVRALKTPHPPPDALSLVLEKMPIITARLDAQAIETAAMRHRDALRDTPPV
jgi:hypothetical protein